MNVVWGAIFRARKFRNAEVVSSRQVNAPRDRVSSFCGSLFWELCASFANDINDGLDAGIVRVPSSAIGGGVEDVTSAGFSTAVPVGVLNDDRRRDFLPLPFICRLRGQPLSIGTGFLADEGTVAEGACVTGTYRSFGQVLF